MLTDATTEDARDLTEVAFAAKRHWRYPEEYYQRWSQELTITEPYLRRNLVRCKRIEGSVVGFYSLLFLDAPLAFANGFMESGFWLDHMFVRPEYHHQGIGTEFFRDLNALITHRKVAAPIRIFVDPNAVGFYEKMGAMKVRVSGSSIPGREISVYRYR